MRALLFFLEEGWASLRRNPAASLAAVSAMGAVLFVLLLFMLLGHNILLLAGRLEERKGLSVFLDPGVPQEQITELRHHFASFPEVRALRFVSRAEALREVEEDLEMEALEQALGDNPLPDAFLVTPRTDASDVATLERLAREMESYPGVEDVLYGRRWVAALDRGLRVVRRASGLTGLVATLAIILVLGNTLRLLVLLREEQLAVLRIIGATDAFLRAPFVAAGEVLCLSGAVLAQFALRGGYLVTRSLLPGLRFLPLSWMILFLLGVGLLGLLGSLVTVQISLRALDRGGGGRDA